MEHHQYTLVLSQGHWQKPYCTRAGCRIPSMPRFQSPQMVCELLRRQLTVSSWILTCWSEEKWFLSPAQLSGRRTIKDPVAGLDTCHLHHWVFSTDIRRDREQRSQKCAWASRDGREKQLCWAVGTGGAEGAQLCTGRGRSGRQAVMALVGEPYSCHVGSRLRGCHWAPPRNSASERTNGYRQVSGKTFV